MKQPVIIIGMHYGGTSLVSEMLHSAGIFMGNDQNEKAHSKLFRELNSWIFQQVGATWDNPYNFSFLNDDFSDRVAKALKRHLKGRHLKPYLDDARHRYCKVERFDFDWGWSDPLNTFTIDLWKRVFDGVRIIHVHRNPVDVIHDLQKQNERFREETDRGLFGGLLRRSRERRLISDRLYEYSLRLNSLDQGFELWKSYVEKANDITTEGGNSIYHLAYEDLIRDFDGESEKLFTHLGYKLPDGALKEIKEKVRHYKPHLFLKNGELSEYYQAIKNHSLVIEMNYHNIK